MDESQAIAICEKWGFKVASNRWEESGTLVAYSKQDHSQNYPFSLVKDDDIVELAANAIKVQNMAGQMAKVVQFGTAIPL